MDLNRYFANFFHERNFIRIYHGLLLGIKPRKFPMSCISPHSLG